MEDHTDQKKVHRKRQAGPKAAKKKVKKGHEQDLTPQQRNPKAFSIQHANKTLRTVQRTQDLKTKKQHIPLVDRTPLEPPPVIVGVVGPPKVGKTTLLKCIVKNFTKQRLTRIQGPVTVVSGKQRRLTVIECNNDISAMIDIAKVADLVLLLVDASFGFEMETFEFLNICQVHGFPRIMGVLTHLDSFKDNKKLRKTKKRLKHRFWTEVYQGAKLFYLSGMVNGEYQKTEVHNLCRFISVMKFRPLTWRTTHPYVLADRMEDITDPEEVRQNNKCDRNVSLYGYLHGTHMKNNINVHIPGCGDFSLHDVQFLTDPCPTPEKQKKRSLSQKDRLVYAPMSGVGGIVYDKDAVYIDLGGSHSHTDSQKDEDVQQPVNELVASLMALTDPLDKKMTMSRVALYSEGIKKAEGRKEIQVEDCSESQQFESVKSDDRVRRRAVFRDEEDTGDDDEDDDSGRESDDDDALEDSEIIRAGMELKDDSDDDSSSNLKSHSHQKQTRTSTDKDKSVYSKLAVKQVARNQELSRKAFVASHDSDDVSSDSDDESDDFDDGSDEKSDESDEEDILDGKRRKLKSLKQKTSSKTEAYRDNEFDNSEDSDDNEEEDEEEESDSDASDDDLLAKTDRNVVPKKLKSDKVIESMKDSARLKEDKLSKVLSEQSQNQLGLKKFRKSKNFKTTASKTLSKDSVSSDDSESDDEEVVLPSNLKTKTKSDEVKTGKAETVNSDSESESESDSGPESDTDEKEDFEKETSEIKTKLLAAEPEKVKTGKSKSTKDKDKLNEVNTLKASKEDKRAIKSLSDKLVSLSQTDYYSWKPAETSAKDAAQVREYEGEDDDDEEEEEESMGDEEEEEDMSGMEEDDEDYGGESFQWKSDLASQAAANFRERQANRINYRKLIYGKEEENKKNKDEEEEEDEIGGLFKVLKEKSEASAADRISINSTDCSKPQKYTISQLDIDQIQELIADCFVTGKWDESQDAEALLQKDDEMYGDFEDLETGETHAADDRKSYSDEEEEEEEATDVQENEEKKPEEVKKKKSEMTAEERRAEKKRKLKEMFDAQYDVKGDTEFYDSWKEELEQQAKLNRSVFEDMEDELRVQYEGFRPGMYLRVEIHGVPCELVTNFDPTYPVILGGLLSVENNVGFVQTRLKKHRWHKKILKTKNPLIFSLGWRRFQSIPLYSIQDHNMRNRLLKYTPEHLHCHACFWGPITPQGTGLLAVENVVNVTPDFRIAATGVVLELDKSFQIVKKLKLIGTPQKIYSKTAFIQGMFNSSLEVAKFEGASLRTVSGIRGQIKKAVKTPEGAFRATFEDKILLSDMVFLRTWYPVEVPQFYNPVTTMLLPPEQKQNWTGLKTYGDLYREKNIKPTFSEDSKYKKIERKGKSYTPLSIPKALQRVLPFKDTPKSLLEKHDPVKRVAVVKEPHEAKIAKMVSMLKNVYEHKRRTEHAQMRQRAAQHQKERQKIDREKQKKHREVKKQVFRMLGKMEQRKNAHKNKD